VRGKEGKCQERKKHREKEEEKKENGKMRRMCGERIKSVEGRRGNCEKIVGEEKRRKKMRRRDYTRRKMGRGGEREREREGALIKVRRGKVGVKEERHERMVIPQRALYKLNT
jgi:hypothetical protein